jgi:hypothetical protein
VNKTYSPGSGNAPDIIGEAYNAESGIFFR